METPSIEINKSVGDAGPRTSLVVDDVRVLPRALTKLHEMGYDLSGVIEAIHDIEAEEQRKRSAAEELKAKLTQKAMLAARTTQARRFIVVATKENEVTQVAEGVEFGNGKLYIDGVRYPIHGLKDSRRSYENGLANNGYSYHIEYID